MTPVILIPVLDEARTIGRVVAEAVRHAPVIVVDDGSRDGSVVTAREAGAEVIRHPARAGKGRAIWTGIEAARRRGASVVVTLDGDGQHDPADVPVLLAAARESPRTVVVGSRMAGAATLPPGRLNAIRVAGFFVNWVSGLRLLDTQSGFRAYPLGLFAEVEPRRGGFVFETEVLVAAAALGWTVREVPVRAIGQAERPSRLRPLADGVPISAYLAGESLRRWGREVRAGAAEVASVFRGERRRTRHLTLLATCAPHADSPAAWATAVGVTTARWTAECLAAWWRHPRRQRAAAAAVASLATPALLGLVVATLAGRRRVPDLVTPLVHRVYSQDRLAPLGSDARAVLTRPVAPASRGGPRPEVLGNA
jgi:hypothetical protein